MGIEHFQNFYHNRRILLTGHTGFKGSWLAIWLKELGAEIVGYAMEPPSDPSNFGATGLAERMHHIPGDVRDMDHLLDVFTMYKPEMVFHLAAQALVGSSYKDPKTTFDTNIGGTVNIMEAVRRTDSVQAMVNVTSDKCYRNREWVWGYRENDPMGGHDPYSASKGGAELVFAAYLQSFFCPNKSKDVMYRNGRSYSTTGGNSTGYGRQIGLASCRAGNAIGGGDWGKDRLIPDCVSALMAAKVIEIRKAGVIRPWQHVLEVLSGYLWLGVCLWEDPEKYSGGWNFGPPNEAHVTVGEIVTRFIQAWGAGQWKNISFPGAFREATALRLCCDKAATYLGWRNVLSLEQSIAMTTDWYKIFFSGPVQESLYDFCAEQISQYVQMARNRKLVWTREVKA